MEYTLSEIKAAWDKFNTTQAFCVLSNGKWKNTPMMDGFRPPLSIQGTAAKTRHLKDIMDFPEYLEKHWNGNNHG